jgi:hydrogenase expression/formation protein HypD
MRVVEAIFRRDINTTSRLVNYSRKFLDELRGRFGREYVFKFMNFCGTHEWTITHFGIRSLVGGNIELIAGPGCPVCVTPSYYIELAMKLALEGFVIYTYGDTFRLPSINQVNGARNLAEIKALGADVRISHSIVHAILDAKRHNKPSIFLGIGFETVTPGYAEAIMRNLLPPNLKIMSLPKLTPPAMLYALEIVREKPTDYPIMGGIAPGHVSTMVGVKAWTPIAENFGIPVVISGFEPNDVLMAIAEILRQLVRGEARVVNQYRRAVTWEGDVKAQSVVRTAFETVDTAWRGIGYIPKSGLAIREEFGQYDAVRYYGLRDLAPEVWRYDLPPGCKCAEVTIGKARPTDCPLFMKQCTPDHPVGPCMVSMEGTCSVWARFGGGGLANEIAKDIELR